MTLVAVLTGLVVLYTTEYLIKTHSIRPTPVTRPQVINRLIFTLIN